MKSRSRILCDVAAKRVVVRRFNIDEWSKPTMSSISKSREYWYDLPPDLVAKTPAAPRDSARLMVYDTQNNKASHDTFLNIDDYLPDNGLLVFNDTMVVPARVIMRKETGGKAEVLLFVGDVKGNDRCIKGLVDRKVEKGQCLFFDKDHFLTMVCQEENIFVFEPNFSMKSLFSILNKKGKLPIPLYIKDTPLSERQRRVSYQTIFARHPASIAAPTAALHFTNRIMEKIKRRGLSHVFVTLNIGLGTFAPVTEVNLAEGRLHRESYLVPFCSAKSVRQAKKAGTSVIAVGTTVTRTLESAARDILSGPEGVDISGSTELFIRPSFDFKIIDGLITNFHQRGTSLLYLVDSFLRHKKSKRSVVSLYEEAVRERIRFFSFGDVMLIV